MSHTITVEDLRDLYDAALELDAERAIGLMHPDIVVREPSVLPYGGVYRGVDGFAEVLTEVMKVIDFTTLKINAITADGATGLVNLQGTLFTGDPVELVEVWTKRDGRFATCQVFWFDPAPVLATRT